MQFVYRESRTISAGTAVAVRHDGSVSVVRREIVTSNVAVSVQRHVVDARQPVTELDRRQYAAYQVTQPHDELDVLIADDRR